MARYSHTVKVESTEEYKEAVEAAETLGLELVDVEPSRYGWEPEEDGYALHPRDYHDIVKVGYKYVHFDIDGQIVKAEFREDRFDDEEAYLRLCFN